VLPSRGRTRFAPAWAGLADARSAARKAIALDDSNSEAHAALGWILIFKDWDFQEASYASMGQKDKAFEWLQNSPQPLPQNWKMRSGKILGSGSRHS
jgi:hypothetical protein